MMNGDDKLITEPETDMNKNQNSNISIMDGNISTNPNINVDISDAMSEKDKVLFTVHTKSSLDIFKNKDFSVTRQHEDFIWLFNALEENTQYAGILFPPPPTKPDFDESREKLQRLGEGEHNMIQEEFNKIKAELEAEYLATFKKTVAMHEIFLKRIAGHPSLFSDYNFVTFLQYEQELSVRGRNRKEKLNSILKIVTKTADETLLLKNEKEEDPFFIQQKGYLNEYHTAIKGSTSTSDALTKDKKKLASSYMEVSSGLFALSTSEVDELSKFLSRFADYYETFRNTESRIAADDDLKMSDTFRYYRNDTESARTLLYRRSKALADYDSANKSLDKARSKGKDVTSAEKHQNDSYEKFKTITDTARTELTDFKDRRLQYFKKNLTELAKFQIKHTKSQIELLRETVKVLEQN